MRYFVNETAEMTNGTAYGENAVITGITKDSRTVNKGDLFIALSGERFDAHDFVAQVAKSGAAAALVERKLDVDIPQIVVKSTKLALGDFARAHCAKFDIPKVAVTGSVGKTTTRDLIASVLMAHYGSEFVLKTQGNYNNDIGLPFTVLGLEEKHRAAVIEMGMNHFGEISYLTNIVKPDIAVITNAGTAHIENLGSREGILKAKCEIFEGLKPNGTKVLNLDNDMLATVKGENILFYSINNSKADIYASDMVSKGLKGTEFTVNTPKGSFRAQTMLPGEHIVSNALAAAAVGHSLGISFEEIADGIRDFVPTSGRMDIIDTPRYTVINGAYNANPDSMRASIEVLKQADTYKCAILGDMFELGDYAADMHKKVGEEAAELDMVIAIGELSRAVYEAAGKNAMWFATVDEFLSALDEKQLIPSGASVLVKASHSMHFEKIVEKLEEK